MMKNFLVISIDMSEKYKIINENKTCSEKKGG